MCKSQYFVPIVHLESRGATYTLRGNVLGGYVRMRYLSKGMCVSEEEMG